MNKFILCWLLAYSSISLAQSNNNSLEYNSDFIEVIVSDTVQLVPDKIIYKVDIAQQCELTALSGNSKALREQMEKCQEKNKTGKQIAIALLEKQLKEMNLSYTTLASNPYALQASPLEINAYWITFSSYAQLGTFVNILKETPGLFEGRIISEESSHIKDPQPQLIKKLFAEGRKQAEELASLLQIKLGKMILMTEDAFGQTVMKKSYAYFVGLDFNDQQIMPELPAQFIIVEKKLLVRFAIE